jgi:hypothetical protein
MNEDNSINYTYKAHNHKINELINFNDYPKLNAILIGLAYIYGWILNLHLLDIQTFTWEFLIKGSCGVILAVITAIAVKFGTDIIYTEILKPRILKLKIFKNGKSNKTKTNKTDRNAA